jgi:hypothetical protein
LSLLVGTLTRGELNHTAASRPIHPSRVNGDPSLISRGLGEEIRGEYRATSKTDWLRDGREFG